MFCISFTNLSPTACPQRALSTAKIGCLVQEPTPQRGEEAAKEVAGKMVISAIESEFDFVILVFNC